MIEKIINLDDGKNGGIKNTRKTLMYYQKKYPSYHNLKN